MKKAISPEWALSAGLMALSACVVTVLFMVQADIDFSLSDEGFLWYGVQQTLQGALPIRDFMAYDPARYAWCAAIMQVLGSHGLIALRVSLALMQWAGLCIALLMLRKFIALRTWHEWVWLLLCMTVLLVWMYPRYKIFDITASVAITALAVSLMANAGVMRCFLAGVVVGILAIVGLNHGFYGIAGIEAVIVCLALMKQGPGFWKGSALFVAGVVIGYLPMLLAFMFVPDFFGAFWQRAIALVSFVEKNNMTIPVPWLWDITLTDDSIRSGLKKLMRSCFFTLLIAFPLLALARCFTAWKTSAQVDLKSSNTAAVLASALICLPYAHHVTSRADISHLAQGIFPLLCGLLLYFSGMSSLRIKWAVGLLLLVASQMTTRSLHPDADADWQRVDIRGDTILVDSDTLEAITFIQRVNQQYSAGENAILIVPFWPGAYALLGKKSPLWESYALVNRAANFEQMEINNIRAANPSAVIITDVAAENVQNILFQNTHPATEKYIRQHYRQIEGMTARKDWKVYQRAE